MFVIGRKEDTVQVSETPFLSMGEIVAFFHEQGTIPEERERLNNSVKKSRKRSEHNLRRCVGMESHRECLFGSLRIERATSYLEIG